MCFYPVNVALQTGDRATLDNKEVPLTLILMASQGSFFIKISVCLAVIEDQGQSVFCYLVPLRSQLLQRISDHLRLHQCLRNGYHVMCSSQHRYRQCGCEQRIRVLYAYEFQFNSENEDDTGDKKSKNILQRKDELVKMKNFLNQKLREINKLIPQKGSMREPGSARKSEEISSVEIEKIVSINRRLFTQNEKLVAELTRQRRQKKELSKSLKKQKKMLSQLCENSHRDLQHRHEEIRKLTRKASLGQNNYISQLHLNSPKKASYPPLPNNKQKASIWHTRKQSRSLFQKFQTQTSILNKPEKPKQKQKTKKDKTVKQTTPCYSESQEEMITNLKEIADLEGKLRELMAESRDTGAKMISFIIDKILIISNILPLRKQMG